MFSTFLGLKTYYIAIDGSTVGDGCITLMASLYYKGRAIPLTWITIVGKKGHFPEYLHIQLIEQLRLILPENADVVVTGDGEFDGVGFVQVIEDYQWEYVVRTANNTIIKTFDGDEYSFVELTPKKGRSIIISDILFTEEEHYIQSAVVWWRKDCKTPLFLISNIDKKKRNNVYI